MGCPYFCPYFCLYLCPFHEAVLEDKHFQGLSVTPERWLPLGEVRSWGEGGREGGGGGVGVEKEKGEVEVRIGGGGKRDKGIKRRRAINLNWEIGVQTSISICP